MSVLTAIGMASNALREHHDIVDSRGDDRPTPRPNWAMRATALLDEAMEIVADEFREDMANAPLVVPPTDMIDRIEHYLRRATVVERSFGDADSSAVYAELAAGIGLAALQTRSPQAPVAPDSEAKSK